MSKEVYLLICSYESSFDQYGSMAIKHPRNFLGVFDITMAEEQGFEPWRPFGLPVFKTGAFNRSAIPPWDCWARDGL